jgi:hypothetical protein
MYQQNHSDSSTSSSDEETLDRRAAGVGSGTIAKRKDQLRQKKEVIRNFTSGQVGARKEDRVADGDSTPIANGEGHQESHVQDREPVSSEKVDDQAPGADGELTSGEQSEKVGELGHPHEAKQEPFSKEEMEGNGDV